MKPQSASSFTFSITSLFTMTFLLFTPTSCCPQGSTHLSEEKKRTVHLLSFGVPRIGKSDYLKKNKKVVFQINKYNCIHWGLLQLALSADMHAAATHSFDIFPPPLMLWFTHSYLTRTCQWKLTQRIRPSRGGQSQSLWETAFCAAHASACMFVLELQHPRMWSSQQMQRHQHKAANTDSEEHNRPDGKQQ